MKRKILRPAARLSQGEVAAKSRVQHEIIDSYWSAFLLAIPGVTESRYSLSEKQLSHEESPS